MLNSDETLAIAARALSHPTRVRIVRILAASTECVAGEIFDQLEFAQSTISEHLRILKEAGVITAHTLGTRVVYCVDPEVMDSFASSVLELTESIETCDRHERKDESNDSG